MKNKVFVQYYTWASIFAFFGSLRGMCPLKRVDLQEKWNRISQFLINSLIDTMPQKCSTLLTVRGNHTPTKTLFFKETPFLFDFSHMHKLYYFFLFYTQILNNMQFLLLIMCIFFSFSLSCLLSQHSIILAWEQKNACS